MSRASGAAIIEAWRRKAYDYRDDDVAKTLICRTLEMLEVIERGYDREIEFKLANMRNERETARRFDKRMDQPHRQMLYTLSESVERLCELMIAQQKVAEEAIAEAQEERARRQAEMPEEEELEQKYGPAQPVDMTEALGMNDPLGPIDPLRVPRSISPPKFEDDFDVPQSSLQDLLAPQAPIAPVNPRDFAPKRITSKQLNVTADIAVSQSNGVQRSGRVRQQSQSSAARRGAASAVNEGVVKEEEPEDPLLAPAVSSMVDEFKMEDTDIKDEPIDAFEDENSGSQPLPGPSHTNNMLINQMMMRREAIPRVRRANEPASRRESIRKRREGSSTENNLSCHKCPVQGMAVKEWFDHLRNVHNSSAAKEFLALACECGDLTSTKYNDFTLHKYSCNKNQYKIVKATWTS